MLTLDGRRSRVTMPPLVIGLLTFLVATSGVRDIVRINNNCKDALLKNRLVTYTDKKFRAAVTRCKGEVQADAKLILQEEGFVPLESVYVEAPPPSHSPSLTLSPQSLLR